MNIINKEVKQFEEGKNYIFVADKIEVRDIHKWADLVDGQLVNVKLQDLGFVTMNRPNRTPQEMPVYPRLCYEVELNNLEGVGSMIKLKDYYSDVVLEDEDNKKVKCVNCEKEFLTLEILLEVNEEDDDIKEHCPHCKKEGCLMDL